MQPRIIVTHDRACNLLASQLSVLSIRSDTHTHMHTHPRKPGGQQIFSRPIMRDLVTRKSCIAGRCRQATFVTTVTVPIIIVVLVFIFVTTTAAIITSSSASPASPPS